MLLPQGMQADSQTALTLCKRDSRRLREYGAAYPERGQTFLLFFQNEVTHVVDCLTDLAVDVGFGARLWCRGEPNPHSPGRRARGLDRQRSSGTQSGLARPGTLIRLAPLHVVRGPCSLIALPGLSRTS